MASNLTAMAFTVRSFLLLDDLEQMFWMRLGYVG